MAQAPSGTREACPTTLDVGKPVLHDGCCEKLVGQASPILIGEPVSGDAEVSVVGRTSRYSGSA